MSNLTEFTDGDIKGVDLIALTSHNDERGWLIELFRNDEIDSAIRPMMGYVSETLPGVTRGPHRHHNQTDHFAVIGSEEFEFCLWDVRAASSTAGNRMTFRAGGDRALRVTVPAGIVHAYRNVSERPARLLNFPDKLYAGEGRRHAVDEVRYEDAEDHPFHW